MKLLFSVACGLLCSSLALHVSNAEVKPQLSGIVHTEETDIAYEQFGHNFGHTPAIVVNGGPGFSHTYMYLTDVFTKKLAHDRTVTFYDQRGIGKSMLKIPDAPQGMDAQIADLEALRTRLGFDKIDLIGHSWGGILVMAYAASYPQHIQHLVLIDSGATKFSKTIDLFDQVFPDELAVDDQIEKKEGKLTGAVLRRFLARDFYNQERFKQLTGKLSDKDIESIDNVPIHEAVVKGIESFDVVDSLKKFDFPTLVIWGRFDVNVALVTGWQLSQDIPGSKLVIYPKSGHFPFYDQESEFLHDLNGFLDK